MENQQGTTHQACEHDIGIPETEILHWRQPYEGRLGNYEAPLFDRQEGVKPFFWRQMLCLAPFGHLRFFGILG